MQDTIANVTVDGVSLEQELLDSKLAYEYSGGIEKEVIIEWIWVDRRVSWLICHTFKKPN